MYPGLLEKGGIAITGIGYLVATTLGDNLGLVVSVVFIVGGLSGAIMGARQKAANQALRDAGQAWRDERDAERARADRVERENADLTAKIGRVEEELRARPEISEIVKEIRAGNGEMVKAITATTTAVQFLASRIPESSA
jgi:hypothetical protein